MRPPVKEGHIINAFETVRRRKDGSRVDVSISLSPLTDGFGRTIAVTGMTRDISATKQADRALRASEEQYRRICGNGVRGHLAHRRQ
jgi:PAS domain-containing protein